ncbi:MAG TPA: hypothetical protein VFR29_10625 [Steroidobacteraceae bacterium]|nr:hypothetical protein [Steroidobacteraceae bacterium]
MSLLRRGGFFGRRLFGRSGGVRSRGFARSGGIRRHFLGRRSHFFGSRDGGFLDSGLFLLGTTGAQHKGNRNGAQNLCIHRQIPQVRTVRWKGKVRGENIEAPASLLLRVKEF